MNSKMVELIDMLCNATTSEMLKADIQKAYEKAMACGLKTREEFKAYGLYSLWFWAVEMPRLCKEEEEE